MYFVNSAVPKDPKGNAYSIKSIHESRTGFRWFKHGSIQFLLTLMAAGKKSEVSGLASGKRLPNVNKITIITVITSTWFAFSLSKFVLSSRRHHRPY